MAPAYKLTYFNIKGLAEPIRFLLSYGGIEFEDKRIPHDENWVNEKSKYPFGQLPVLEHNGKVCHQSTAICRYVAKQVKLTGNNDWEDLEIDAVVDSMKDLFQKMIPLFSEKDETVKEKIKTTLQEETLPYFLSRFNNSVKSTGYLAVGRLTWADISFIASLELLNYVMGCDIIAKYPEMTALKEKILAIPNIKAWIEKRPKTER